MQLYSKALAGKEMNFTSTVYDHASFRLLVGEDGAVQLYDRGEAVLEDDKGNTLEVVEVDQGPGEPVLQAFLFDGDIPEEYEDFVFEHEGQDLVPARYVHGAISSKELTNEIPDDLAEEILADSGVGGFFFVSEDVETEEDEEVEPDVEPEDETN